MPVSGITCSIFANIIPDYLSFSLYDMLSIRFML